MAASSEDKDYVHQIVASLAKLQGAPPEFRVRNIADFERQYATFADHPQTAIQEDLDWNAEYVVLAIGENVPGLSSDTDKAAFHRAVSGLLEGLKTRHPVKLVVRSCFWPDETKDRILREVSQEVGAQFVDISAIGRDPANTARSERSFTHAGVAAHPGDQGMRAIAEAIFQVLSRN